MPKIQVDNFKKVPFILNILSKNLTDYSTQQYCHVKFPFKFFVKLVDKIVFKQKRFSENNYINFFEALYLLKLCPIFVGSLNNFGKRYKKIEGSFVISVVV